LTPPTMRPIEAVRRFIRPGDRVLLGTAAGEARTLQQAMISDQERLHGLHLVGGLQIGDYDFMGPVRNGEWRYDTWQVGHSIRDDVSNGHVGFHHSRGALVPGLIRALRPQVFVTAVSPPDKAGMVSFGASVSYALTMASEVERVIAEVNPAMPRVHGRTTVPLDLFDAIVEAEQPLPTHRAVDPDLVAKDIAASVRSLLPEDATVQIGLGSVPEALVAILGEDPPPGMRLFGMGVDGMLPFLEAAGKPGSFLGGELLGTELLYSFAHDNPVIENHPITDLFEVPSIAAIPNFVALNGALQVDLTGQVNSEWVAGRQVSAPGASFDFVDGSWFSPGGKSITAIRSTARNGTVSTIVPAFAAGTPVTIPRHSTRFVVTEHGHADMLTQRTHYLSGVDVPWCVGHKWTATYPAQRSIDEACTGIEGCLDRGHPVDTVDMDANWDLSCQFDGGFDETRYRLRRAGSDRVGKQDRWDAKVERPLHQVEHDAGRNIAFKRAAEGTSNGE
jgi:4-hydroxybutyrate CoA-transferase